MNEHTKTRNRLLSEKVIKGLTSRNMTGYYAETKEEALNLALSLIPKGSKIARGGSMTMNEIGLTDALETGNYEFKNREKSKEPGLDEFAFSADVYVTGTNAITQDGILVNIDGNSNRVSSIAYGPKKVILLVSMDKVCDDVDGAMKRARNVAAPTNAQRFDIKTPCKSTGSCMNCLSPDTICCQFLITRFSKHKDRIHVILIGEKCGF